MKSNVLIIAGRQRNEENEEVLKKVMDKDYQFRPNYWNMTEEGPGRDDFANIIRQKFKAFIPNFTLHSQDMLLCEDGQFVGITKLTGTVNNPTGMEEIPLFTGIPAQKLEGKSFETFIMVMIKIKNGMGQHEYHVEDWAGALTQMLSPDLGFDPSFIPQ